MKEPSVTLKDVGFIGPGLPPDRMKLKETWMAVYLALMMTKSHNPEQQARLDKLQILLAQANELVMEVLEGP